MVIPSRSSWRIDKPGTTGLSPAPPTRDHHEDSEPVSRRFPCWIGPAVGAGGTIDRVAGSTFSGDVAEAANVTITRARAIADGHEPSVAADAQAPQIGRSLHGLGTFSAGDYMFSMAGLPDLQPVFEPCLQCGLGGVLRWTGRMLLHSSTGSANGSVLSFIRPRTPAVPLLLAKAWRAGSCRAAQAQGGLSRITPVDGWVMLLQRDAAAGSCCASPLQDRLFRVLVRLYPASDVTLFDKILSLSCLAFGRKWLRSRCHTSRVAYVIQARIARKGVT